MQKSGSSIIKKIILVLLISALTLIGLYLVYKLAFNDIYKTVGNLSYPNKKLSAVNTLFFEISKSEKTFRNLIATENEKSFDEFISHSGSIKRFSDSLRVLCINNDQQISTIDSINVLIESRNIILLDYLKYRKTLNSNNPILKQINSLDSIISSTRQNEDLLVRTNEHKKTITKIDTLETEVQAEKKSLWSQLFRRSKPKPTKVERTEQEDTDTKIDTIKIANQYADSAGVQKIIADISKIQNIRRNRFLSKEVELNEFEKAFSTKIIELLSAVEKDVIQQTATTQQASESVISKSITRIYTIIAFFFLSTAIVVILILVDVTKSNRYKQLLEKAKEEAEYQGLEKQRFLSNMSHEIRTPLQSIIGYSEQLEKINKKNDAYVDIIQHSSEHLLQVINEVLDYSRINSGKFSFEKADFNIRQVISEVVAIVKVQANKKNIELFYNENDIPDSFVNGDPFRLKQILLNLLGNAVKFTEQGRVKLEVSKEIAGGKEKYTFRITDTGIGIPYHMQDKIFEQFERADLPAGHKYGGTGLGLSITKALVEGQEGKITVKSEPGKGSCFSFTIQYEKSAETMISKSPEPILHSGYEGVVWLVDDDALILQLCSDILSKHKVKHRCFNSAIALLNEFSGTKPDIILIDIRMPEMNGIELCRKLRENYSGSISLIAITAHVLPDEKEQLLNQGFDSILMKPFRESELLQLFNIYIKNNSVAESGIKPGKLNLNALRRMVDNDQNELNKIIRQYILETKQDILLITGLMETNRIAETALIIHRISGRTSQLGAKELGAALRKLETSIDSDYSSVMPSRIMEMLNRTQEVITELEILLAGNL